MSTLRSQVETVLHDGTAPLEALVRAHADPSTDVAAWTGFLADYLRKAAETSEALATAIAGHPLEARVRPFLAEIVAYAAEPEDAVPDRLGAPGLLDDAFLVMACIETLRDLMRQPADRGLATANAIVGELLGDPVVARIRSSIESIKQRVIVDTLLDLRGLGALFLGALTGKSLAIDVPTPTFTFPAPRTPAPAPAPASTPAAAAPTDASLVGVWEYENIYSSPGFSGSTVLTRTFTGDGRFSQRARSSASLTHTASDGTWNGVTDAHSGAPADDRGSWRFDGRVLELLFDDGSASTWKVTRTGSAALLAPIGGGSARLWQRVR